MDATRSLRHGPKRLDRQGRGGLSAVDVVLREVKSFPITDTVHELDDVALLQDWPEHALVAGQVGTVVQSLADDQFQVEFNGEDGRANATAALPARNLMVLHYAPVTA